MGYNFIVKVLLLILSVENYASDFTPICSEKASLKPISELKLLEQISVKIAIDLTLYEEIFADIEKDYKKAKLEINKIPKEQNNLNLPVMVGDETNYFLLPTEYPIFKSAIACYLNGLERVSVKYGSELLNLLKILADRSPPITKFPVELMAIGTNVYNLKGDFVKKLKMSKKVPDENNQNIEKIHVFDETEQEKEREKYNSYPSFVLLNEAKDNTKVEFTLFSQQKDNVSVICQSRKRLSYSTEKETFDLLQANLKIIKTLENQFLDAAKFYKDLSNYNVQSGTVVSSPVYKIFPASYLLKVRKQIRMLSQETAWKTGKITAELLTNVINFMKKYINFFRGRESAVKIEMGNMAQLNKMLKNYGITFVDSTVVIQPLITAEGTVDNRTEANLKLMVHNPNKNLAKIYAILTNIHNGEVITDNFAVQLGTHTEFTSENHPFNNLDCRYGVDKSFCTTSSNIDSIKTKGSNCARELFNSNSDKSEESDCPTDPATGCLGYYVKCNDEDKNVIISCYQESKLDVYCGLSNYGTVTFKAGRTREYVENAILILDGDIVLAEQSNGSVLTDSRECIKPLGSSDTGGMTELAWQAIMAGGVSMLIIGCSCYMKKCWGIKFPCKLSCCKKKPKTKQIELELKELQCDEAKQMIAVRPVSKNKKNKALSSRASSKQDICETNSYTYYDTEESMSNTSKSSCENDKNNEEEKKIRAEKQKKGNAAMMKEVAKDYFEPQFELLRREFRGEFRDEFQSIRNFVGQIQGQIQALANRPPPASNPNINNNRANADQIQTAEAVVEPPPRE